MSVEAQERAKESKETDERVEVMRGHGESLSLEQAVKGNTTTHEFKRVDVRIVLYTFWALISNYELMYHIAYVRRVACETYASCVISRAFVCVAWCQLCGFHYLGECHASVLLCVRVVLHVMGRF